MTTPQTPEKQTPAKPERGAGEKITADVSDRICKHMNRDHTEAVLKYVHQYSDQTEATAATLTAIDPTGMDLEAEVNGTKRPVRVPFDHELKDAADAHHTLVAMLRG